MVITYYNNPIVQNLGNVVLLHGSSSNDQDFPGPGQPIGLRTGWELRQVTLKLPVSS